MKLITHYYTSTLLFLLIACSSCSDLKNEEEVQQLTNTDANLDSLDSIDENIKETVSTVNSLNLENHSEKIDTALQNIVEEIDKKYEVIENTFEDENHYMMTIDDPDISSKGGKYFYYYDQSEDSHYLNKIKEIVFNKEGKIERHYYQWKNRFIYVRTYNFKYDKSSNSKDQKISSTTEEKFYIHEGKLVKWLDGDNKVMEDKLYEDKFIELLNRLSELLIWVQ